MKFAQTLVFEPHVCSCPVLKNSLEQFGQGFAHIFLERHFVVDCKGQATFPEFCSIVIRHLKQHLVHLVYQLTKLPHQQFQRNSPVEPIDKEAEELVTRLAQRGMDCGQRPGLRPSGDAWPSLA